MKEELSLEQAAARLGVSRNTIKNMAARGDLHITKKKFGAPRYFVPAADIEALLAKPTEALSPTKTAQNKRKRK